MDTEEHYHQVNGMTLHTVEAGDKEGEPILFLHGFPEFWHGWKNQFSFFAQRGYRVIMPDQRGYNLSSKPPGTRPYCLQHLVADIVALISRLGNRKPILVGHDWGGVVAWQLAMHHPQLLQQLVIINMPHPDVFHQTLKKNIVQMARSSYAAFFQLPFLPEWLSRIFCFALLERSMLKSSKNGAFSKEDMDAYKRAWQQPHALTAMINWYRAYKYNTLSSAGMIDLPTLLIWGKQDRYLLPQMAQQSIDRCLNGKLVMVEDATHWVHHEQPQLVNTHIHQFITRHYTGKGG
ncbi:MAG: alpha/beta hydrolase [Williamsia sp.]|nr:alpha/beta hydrolase [Williamsia sp.]